MPTAVNMVLKAAVKLASRSRSREPHTVGWLVKIHQQVPRLLRDPDPFSSGWPR
jgi:hypothetical protein